LAAKCIDNYIALANRPSTGPNAATNPPPKSDPRLQEVVERMFRTCYDKGDYKPAIGIAIESHRLDVVEEGIRLAAEKQHTKKGKATVEEPEVDEASELMEYVMDLAMTSVQEIALREKVCRNSTQKCFQSNVYTVTPPYT